MSEIKKGYVVLNLLPYKEKLKKDGIRSFSFLMSFFGIAGIVFVSLIHSYYSLTIESQEERNKKLTEVNKKLEIDIKEIATLKEQIKETLEKRQVVEKLQVNRSDGVNVFNELSRSLPEGVVLKAIKRTGDKVNLVGLTQSSSKVSNYVINLDATSVFDKPEIVEVKSVLMKATSSKKSMNMGNTLYGEDLKTNEFSVNVSLERTIVVEKEKKNTSASVAKPTIPSVSLNNANTALVTPISKANEVKEKANNEADKKGKE